MQESAVWVGKSRALKATGVNSHLSLIKFWTLVKLYWHRQLGTALSWFVWDFAFYGNKLFQSTFIGIIVPHASLKTSLEWTLLNSTVALVGYTLLPLLWIGHGWAEEGCRQVSPRTFTACEGRMIA